MKEPLGQNPFGGRGLDGLKIVSRCPVCQIEHNPIETALLDEAGGSHLIYIKCKNCGSGVVAAITPTGMGVNSIGLVTDLSGYEVTQIKDEPRVSADDVLFIAAENLAGRNPFK